MIDLSANMQINDTTNDETYVDVVKMKPSNACQADRQLLKRP